jgi:coenzyme F420 hydrogenase subunit beta
LEAYAVRSLVPRILENASSGGIITATAHHLLSTGQVTGVVATSLAYGPDGPRPRSMIARDIETLLACQGSKYCPVSIHEAIEPLRHRGERIAFIGTPCQIAAVRMLMEQADWLRSAVRFVIGSFCGGMKSYKEMDALIRRQGVQPAEVVRFAFRGGGQPGRMTIEDVHGKKCERPYPDYVTDTGYRKLDRCRLCVDGTAELADLASGDAWLPRFMKSGKTWSIAIARNEDAARLLREMKEKGILEVQPISQDEIRHSQRSNLSSKKKRMTARRRLYRILGRPTPVYDGGFPVADTGLGFELRVHLRHAALSWLERVRLYWPFIRCARWIRGTNECRRSGPPARTEGP